MNHTAAPWTAVPTSKPGSGNALLDIVSHGTEFSPSFIAGEVSLENAPLICAAPKLLKTLIDVSNDSICMRGFHEQFRHQIRSAIAEATQPPA